jgi:hypothetical protein
MDEETVQGKMQVMKTHDETMNFALENIEGVISESKKKCALKCDS